MNRREALAALVSLPAVARISVAEIKPEDVIVFELDDYLPMEAVTRLGDTAKGVWPGRKILVLEKGIHLKVVAEGKATV